ncbi:MAG: MBL fold metallo-hydrolase [Propionibacteriaceae bacterium]|jgi:glyoxylase-like metal-dependent hydrolase (beta-lactamase superfamily II)|nr:MBL fold metallo-hydrolase [Propionibacteriaceae bacterium]
MAIVFESPNVVVGQVSVSGMDNNVYVLSSRNSGEQIVIDAADDLGQIETLLREVSLTGMAQLKLVITTHEHFDHVRALGPLVVSTGARSVAGGDAPRIAAAQGVPTDEVYDGDTVGVNGISLKVVSLVGHTAGSIALVYEEMGYPTLLFTGDSLFPGGVGNTDHVQSRFLSLFTDVVTKLFNEYPDNTIVLPGHGAATTLGVERPHLDEWKLRGW